MSPPRPSESRHKEFSRVLDVPRLRTSIHVHRISRVAFRKGRLHKNCIACCRCRQRFRVRPVSTHSRTLLQAPRFHFLSHLVRARTRCIYPVSSIQYPLLLALLLWFDVTVVPLAVNTCLYKAQMAKRGFVLPFRKYVVVVLRHSRRTRRYICLGKKDACVGERAGLHALGGQEGCDGMW